MTRRQLLLFVLFAGLSVAGILQFSEDWSVQHRSQGKTSKTHEEVTRPVRHAGVSIPGSPLSAEGGENIFVEAPPEHLLWQDPQNPGYEVEIPYFIPWKLYADSIEPLPQSEEGGQVAVRCKNIVFRTYRQPESHVEAMALRRSEDDVVLHREFRADWALVFGRLAAKLQSDKRGKRRVELGRDSVLQLSGNLRIDDRAEGLVITGDEIQVHPKLGSASGTGPFEVKHTAFVLRGEGLDLHRLDENRTRVEIHEKPVLEMLEDVKADGRPAERGLGSEDFRSASVRAEGRAIVLRDTVENEQRLRIEMSRAVRVAQEGGRTLDSDRLVVLAVNRDDPDAPTEARSNGWRLRKLTADGNVKIKHMEAQAGAQAEIVKITTDRLVHAVPDSGVPTTLLEGSTRMTFEGNLPLGDAGRAPGVVYVSCLRRAWIGPVRDNVLPNGTTVLGLRRLLLEGDARVEHTSKGETLEQDVLEGDEIELLFQVADDAADALGVTAPGKREQIAALEFTARGNVRLSGTRLEGSTDLLIARDLQGMHPHLSIIGPGTRVTFLDIGRGQRLLGPNAKTTPSGQTSATPAASSTDDGGEWVLRRLDASGSVEVVTSLGGPSVGMPTHLSGAQLTYEDLSGLATLTGSPARIEATAINGKPNAVSARTLSVERANGLLRARGNVEAGLWIALDGAGPGSIDNLFQAKEPDQATALEITTEDRIDISIVRVSDPGGLRKDAEQLVRIFGPLTAELRSARMVVDRLRAETLSVTMVLSSTVETATDTPRKAVPGAARVRAPSRSPRPRDAHIPALSLVTLEAGEVAVDMSTGTARSIDAFGGVTLRTEMGRILGERVEMRADARTARVIGSRARRAEAWFFDEHKLRNQVMARQFMLRWTETGAEEVRAVGRSDDPVMARLFQPAQAGNGTLSVQRYEISSEGPITVTPTRVDASVVWVSRSLREGANGAWSEPSRLFAPVLVVQGENLLSPRKAGDKSKSADLFRRHVHTVTARGPETYFRYMTDGALIQIWGEEFALDVGRNQAQLSGTPDRDVKYKQGDQVHSDWKRVTIDLDTGLPRMDGPRIRLRTGWETNKKSAPRNAPRRER